MKFKLLKKLQYEVSIENSSYFYFVKKNAISWLLTTQIQITFYDLSKFIIIIYFKLHVKLSLKYFFQNNNDNNC